MATSDDNIRTYLSDQPLPPQAVDLFGHEVEEAFTAARDGAPDAGEPVVIAATGNGEWRAGVFLLVESVGTGPAAVRVASIRQLVVKPAFRGRGLGGWLLRRAQTVATEMGCQRIRSTAGWGCPDHRAMYDRLGYEPTEGDEMPYLVSLTL